jgi:hypothetical protein
MRVIDRRGKETRGERRERILRRIVPGIMFAAVGAVLFGIEGCALVEVAAGRARVTSAWFWIALSGFGAYFLLIGLEALVIGTVHLARPLYRFFQLAAPFARAQSGRHIRPLPPISPETPGERARWNAFWGALRRRRRHD